MQTLTIGRSTYTLSATRNVGELQAKFAKITGKTKKTAIAKERRSYPVFRAGQSTAEYVANFWMMNNLSGHSEFFAPLNSEQCELYTGADTHETIADGDIFADAQQVEQTAPPVRETSPVAPVAQKVAPAAPTPASVFTTIYARILAAALLERFGVSMVESVPTGSGAEVERMQGEARAAASAEVYGAIPLTNDDRRAARELAESFYDGHLSGAPGCAVPAVLMESAAAHMRGSAAGFADHAPARGVAYFEAARLLQADADASRARSAELDSKRAYPGQNDAAARVYAVQCKTAAVGRAINPDFVGMLRKPQSGGFMADFMGHDVRRHRDAIAAAVRADHTARFPARPASVAIDRRAAYDAATIAAAVELDRITSGLASDTERRRIIDAGKRGAIGSRAAVVDLLERLAAGGRGDIGANAARRALADLAASDKPAVQESTPTHAFADVPPLAALSLAKTDGRARGARAAELAAGAEFPEFGGSVRFAFPGAPERFGLAGPDMSGCHAFRFTGSDDLAGHVGFSTLADACAEALARGYEPAPAEVAPPTHASNTKAHVPNEIRESADYQAAYARQTARRFNAFKTGRAADRRLAAHVPAPSHANPDETEKPALAVACVSLDTVCATPEPTQTLPTEPAQDASFSAAKPEVEDANRRDIMHAHGIAQEQIRAMQGFAKDPASLARMLQNESDRYGRIEPGVRGKSGGSWDRIYVQVSETLAIAAQFTRDSIESIGVPETLPALDGLEVSELGPEALAEFSGLRERAQRATARPIPSLRIPGGDLRARVPARFAPLYLVRGAL